MSAKGDQPVDVGSLINEVEGHLLIEATRGEGHAEASRFTRQFGWLTDSRRAEVEERFAEEYVSLARLSWQRTARRGAELRGEYEEAYRMLRQRLLAVWLSGMALLAAAAALVVSLGRP
ncbi:hypothetical protein O1Q96_29820 [Streptomyces sp. Qhu-G9]|uniref:hypothetical protein n=1 Tax=Streptomyces sp. Qhu-G9 TaxID=3452799 RepID=UPI0022AC6DBD|nr:hypothetical protein [Streptomyces aurantiacus]WAU83525.1 hypothetical protein O1Q96_29820 [Streptomyces aurantiacus]